MRIKALSGAILVTVGIATAACGSSSNNNAQPASSAAPIATVAGASASRVGTFTGLNDKHVSGTATVTAGTVVLTGFSSDAGPDLHIYLTDGTEESAVSAGKELGGVASDKASQTFTVSGADAAKYTHVVIHCDKAKAVFGAASLS